MDGLFLENGPFRVKKDLSLEVNPGGWQNYATSIFG
jgi:carboxypeptidase D